MLSIYFFFKLILCVCFWNTYENNFSVKNSSIFDPERFREYKEILEILSFDIDHRYSHNRSLQSQDTILLKNRPVLRYGWLPKNN